MKKVKLIIAICLIIITVLPLVSCTIGKNNENARTYSNLMTEKELSAIVIDDNGTNKKAVTFFDEEINDSYIIDITAPADYDKSKTLPLMIVLGSKIRDIEYQALHEFMSLHDYNIIVATLRNSDENTINKSESRDFIDKPSDFGGFLTGNVLGWICENYNINTNKVIITGYDKGGYFLVHELLTKNSYSNYLIVNPDPLSNKLTEKAQEHLQAEKKPLLAKVCFINSGDNCTNQGYPIADKIMEEIATLDYKDLQTQKSVLDGQGYNTIWCEALIRGLCNLNGWEFGNKEAEIVEKSKQMTALEKDSIKISELSSDHMYYTEVVEFDPNSAQYIQELTIYDEEIGDTFKVHISLPPDYDATKSYPLMLMTDGIWRLSDHPELRKLMINEEIEDIILVSVGYPNDYDVHTIRERDLVTQPDLYLQFLVENLVPYLCEHYKVNTQNMTLTGHSYGGYWGLYSLFHSDTIGGNKFSNYYIGSPSLQCYTVGNKIGVFEEHYYKRSKKLNCNIYMTIGSLENRFKDPVANFMNQLESRKYEGLDLEYEIIEGYDHNTVFKPSIANTVKRFYGTK
jgi:predicted alpha/beta superfamily hydrolase